MPNVIKVRRGTKATLPTLNQGEFGYCTDTNELFVGDGATNHLIPTDPYTLPLFIIDGGGTAITTGIKGDIGPFNFACEIKVVSLLADQEGSIVIDLWKDSYNNYPPTDEDSITAAAPPTISSSNKSQDSTLTDWTKTLASGEILRVNVDSCATIERVTLAISVQRT